ncbi:MAG TPA: glucose-6-phosphate dehydrogenase [Chitinophagaceae bacterium]|nr:glucose-6-phosphate dehydrogenase [Chitinophagaceae bacterium]
MARATNIATIFYIFGGSGDLTHRKLIPALYNLYIDGHLPKEFLIIGLGRTTYSNTSYRNYLKEGIIQHSRRKDDLKSNWPEFSKHIEYSQQDVTQQKTYRSLTARIKKQKTTWGSDVAVIYYLSVAPQLAPAIAEKLHKADLCADPRWSRLVFEKPFGHSLESAKELNSLLQSLFKEEQIYRIDHFLGKETVQNILAFRFANTLFEPIWNSNYIEYVQITATESGTVEDRGNYYEQSGALRDMVQNHMLQLLCMVAMEAPVSFAANEVRNKKVDVLHALRKFKKDEVHIHAIRGQYDSGWINGKQTKPYRSEKGVAATSAVETYAAVKFFVDNWRWRDVPFYLRTGKSLAEKSSHIAIQFKSAPSFAFPAEAAETWRPNRLVINISPKMDIRMRFQAKRPGLSMTLEPMEMVFNQYNVNAENQPEAYETLLYDIIEGDATLFMRADQVEAAWEVIKPIMEAWASRMPVDFPNYNAGTWGPEDAEALVAKDGHHWVNLPV